MTKDKFQFGAATSSRPGTGKIWNVEGDEDLEKNAPPSNNMYDDADDSLGPMGASSGDLSEEDTKILLEKEFDDYYEDRAHKSAGKRSKLNTKVIVFL